MRELLKPNSTLLGDLTNYVFTLFRLYRMLHSIITVSVAIINFLLDLIGFMSSFIKLIANYLITLFLLVYAFQFYLSQVMYFTTFRTVVFLLVLAYRHECRHLHFSLLCHLSTMLVYVITCVVGYACVQLCVCIAVKLFVFVSISLQECDISV